MKFYILLCYCGNHKYFEIFSSKAVAQKKKKYLQKYLDKSKVIDKDDYEFEIEEHNLKNKKEIINIMNILSSWDNFLDNSL